ncbi:MAG: hypothetical protein KDJ76_10735, partial [Xanthobacteraceae bacterium]|nr:hypothetical protein [Xanthobacteraceae bacterium]
MRIADRLMRIAAATAVMFAASGAASTAIWHSAWAGPAQAEGQVQGQGLFELPADAKFSPEKLARIDAFFDNEIRQGKIPGAILTIHQHGKTVYS